MANPTQQDINRLTDAITKLNNSIGGNNYRSSYSSSSRSSALGGNNSPNTDKLENLIKNNGSIVKQFTEMTKKMSNSMKGVNDIYDRLERTTRVQDDNLRKINQRLTDFIKQTGNSVDSLKQLKDISDKAKKAFSDYDKQISEYKNSLKKLNDLGRQRADLENKLNTAKKQKKKTSSLKKDLDDLDKAIADQTKSHSGIVGSLDTTTEAIESLNKVTGTLSDAQLKYLKSYSSLNTSSQFYKNSMDKLKKSTDYLDDSVDKVAGVMVDRSNKIAGAFDKFTNAMKSAAVQLLTIAPKLAYKDFMSQLKNNVGESDYKNDFAMGMSEVERSQIIGENRVGLRVLGGGDEAQGLRTGGKEIQRAAWQYGVTGADATRLGLQYQNSLINSGFGGSAKDTADQLTVMHNFTKDLGLTDDALKGYYDSLIDSQQMQQLQAKYSGQSEEEARASVNKEIKQRLALNQQLGISLDLQKKLDQQRTNTMYGGVANLVMKQVGGEMAWNRYAEANPNATDADKQLFLNFQRGQGAGMTPEQEKRAKELNESVAKYYNDSATKTFQSGDLGAQIGYEAGLEPMRATGFDVQQYVSDWGNAGLRAKSLANTTVANGDVSAAGYKKDQTDIINNTKNAFIDLLPGMEKFNTSILEATTRLEGLAKNPAGSAGIEAGSGLLNFAGTLAGSYLGSKGLKGAGKIAGGIGSKLKGLFTKGGSSVAGAAGEAVGSVGETAAKEGVKVAGEEGIKVAGKTGLKSLLKKIPGLGAIVGLGLGAYRGFHDDDWQGAGEEALSGIASTVPIVGTAASLGIDAHLAYRDFEKGKAAAPNTPQSSAANSPQLNSAVGNDDPNAVQNQNDAKAAQDEQNDMLSQLVKISQEHLDIAKKESDKSDTAPIANGGTLALYTKHVENVRKGIMA